MYHQLIPVSFFPSPFTLYLLHFILKQVTSLVLPNQSISFWGIPHMTVSSHAEKKSTRRMADKLYSLWPLSHGPPVLIQPVKNGFCILKWLRKKKSKRSIVFSDTWKLHTIQISVFINTFLWKPSQFIYHYRWLPLHILAKLSNCKRNHTPYKSLRYLLSGFLQKEGAKACSWTISPSTYWDSSQIHSRNAFQKCKMETH